VLVAGSLVAVMVGAHTNPSKVSGSVDTTHLAVIGPAPALEATGWIDSPPLTPSDLRGKVVLYDFWTYSCINCQRTFPYIRSWYDRYKSAGLVIVGIHSPEFDFEHVTSNVEAAVKRYDVTWPVALDDDMTIWNAFGNQYWPADYVADRQGRIRYRHFGEGDYTSTENVLRTLLDIPAASPRAGTVTGADTASLEHNPETYLGLQYQNPGQPVIDLRAGAHDYPPPAPGSIAGPRFLGHGEIALEPGKTTGALVGKWTVDTEKATSDAAVATILLAVHAKEVNLVMATANGHPADVIVQVDGQPVPVAERGAGVHVDRNDRTIVTVRAPDMYRLFASARADDHLISISTTGPGLQAYDFTFG
jgi:thiol-disulfide isomerase/thioredoxin